MSRVDGILSELGNAFTDNVDQKAGVVFDAKVVITHDGYDELGPKSNIYCVYVLHKIYSNLMISCFKREDWFDGHGDKFYFDGSYDATDKHLYIDGSTVIIKKLEHLPPINEQHKHFLT